MIERDPLAHSAPGVALAVSDLLRSAVVAGTFASRPMGLERGPRPLHLCFGRGAPRRLEGDGYVRAYGPTVCNL